MRVTTAAMVVGIIGGVCIPSASLAVTVESVPNPRKVNGGWVTDMADVLSSSTEAELNQLISELEAKNGSEIAVVTVPETSQAQTPKKFATSLFNHWGIGKKGQDNGVLFLISKGDRRVEIETGYGVENILPDARVGNIIKQEIAPRFKQGDYNGGTLAGTKALVTALKAYAPLPNPSPTKSNLSTNQLPTDTSPTAVNLTANQHQYPYWLGGIGGGGVLLAVIAYMLSRRPVFVEPKGRSRINSWLRRPLHCANCKQPMEKLDSTSLLPHLGQPEQVAQNIGSIRFEGWQCPRCHPHLTGLGMHIRAYVVNSDRFSNCPTCQELTVKRTQKVLKHATQYQEGSRLITYNCHCCSYHQETEETIPRLPPPPPPSTSSGGGGYSGGSSSSGGGGSFAGGSSGGGGAGGSY